MKIGICGYLTGKNADGREFDFPYEAKLAGFDFIEFPLSALASLSEDDFDQVIAALKRSGLPCEACNLFFPGSLRLTGPEVDKDKTRAYMEAALNRAEKVGAQVVVFGSGGARKVPDGFSIEQAWVQLVEMLRVAGEISARHGITIAIEHLNSAETNVINTAAEGYSLAKLAGHPNVGLLLDIYHLVKEGEDFGIAMTARGMLSHAHFAESGQRGFPAAADQTMRAFMDALKGANYTGRLSLEAGYTDFQSEAPLAVEVMRALAAD